MSSIEYIVRPYQTPNSHGSIRIPATPLGTFQRATLTWGAQGTMPAAKAPEQQGIAVNCCSDNVNELSRQSDTIRVTGNDPDNWVDVARARQLKIKTDNKDACAKDWNAQIDADHPWINGTDLMSFDPAGGGGGNCGGTWNFKNQ